MEFEGLKTLEEARPVTVLTSKGPITACLNEIVMGVLSHPKEFTAEELDTMHRVIEREIKNRRDKK